MCGFQDALSNIMPIDWFDPYGRTPFAKDAELSVDITIVETDNGIKATSVKNPPKTGSSRLMDAIKNALGVGFDNYEPENSSQQAADQGKQNDMINNDEKEESDIMESSSPESSKQGSQPWDSGKSSEGSSQDESNYNKANSNSVAKMKDEKEKTPRK